MKDATTAGAVSLVLKPRREPKRGRPALSVSKPSVDALGVALIALVSVTWLSEGAAALAGVSSSAAGKVVDLGEVLILAALAFRLMAERRLRILAPLAVYVAWVATGLVNTHAPGASIETALRNWLLVPVLAGLLAFQEASENRARAVIAGLYALTAFEVVLSLIQLLVVHHAASDSDLIVGSFGTHQNAVIGVITLLVACVGTAGYLVGARRGGLALAVAVILPLSSSWVVIKFTTLLLPVVVLITAALALSLRLTGRRRALVAVGAALLSSGLVLGSYAVFKPQSLSALDPVNGLGNYLTYGSSTGNLARARMGHTIVANYWNAGVRTAPFPAAPRGRAFEIGSLSSGAYTALLTKPGKSMLPVAAGRPFMFQARVANAAGVAQSAVPEIEWHSARRTLLSDSIGSTVPLAAGTHRPALVLVSGFAPPSAAFAVAKIAVFGNLRSGGSIYAWRFKLHRTSTRAAAGPVEGALGETEMGDYWNAGITPLAVPVRAGRPPLVGFRVTNLARGDYTAALTRQQNAPLTVRPGQVYSFTVHVGALNWGAYRAKPEIEWRATAPTPAHPFGGILGTSAGTWQRVPRATEAQAHLQVTDLAPSGARYAVPKVTFDGRLPPGSAAFLSAPALAGIGVLPGHFSLLEPSLSRLSGTLPANPAGGLSASQPAPLPLGVPPGHLPPLKPTLSKLSGRRPTTAVSGPSATQPAPFQGGVLPGHLSLLRTSIRGLTGSLTREMFGFGLGAARLPASFNSTQITPQEAATESDAGTLVIERGWLGVAVVALIALGLAILSLRLSARSVAGYWTTALRLAVPAAIVTMAGYGTLGAMLQNHSAAITFWIILALGVSAGSGRRTRSRGRPRTIDAQPRVRPRRDQR